MTTKRVVPPSLSLQLQRRRRRLLPLAVLFLWLLALLLLVLAAPLVLVTAQSTSTPQTPLLTVDAALLTANSKAERTARILAQHERLRHGRVRIGALAIKGVPTLLRAWKPTFDTYLNTFFREQLVKQVAGKELNNASRNDTNMNIALDIVSNAYNYTFEMVPLDFDTTYTAVRERTIDFIYTNPSVFACLEAEFGVTAVASQVSLRQGQPLTEFGGVFVTRKDSNITRIEQLKGKIVEAVSLSGLGAAQVQFYEMQQRRMHPMQDPRQVRFAFNQKKIVRDVYSGEVDVGMVRTDLLESMHRDGEIDIAQVRVLEPKQLESQGTGTEFPFLVSTDLVPEWPLGALPGLARVATTLSRDVAVALQQMEADSEAALASSVVGWSSPLSYHPLHILSTELGYRDAAGVCKPLGDIYTAITCPPGMERRSRAAYEKSCSRAGLPCPDGYECVCSPCAAIADDTNVWAIVGVLMSAVGGVVLLLLCWFMARVRQVQAEKEQSLLAVKVREDYLAFICHEIRNPLNGAIAALDFTSTLETVRKSRVVQQYISIIESCNRDVLLILNDTLEFNNLERGRITTEKVSFSMSTLLNTLNSMFHNSCSNQDEDRFGINDMASVPTLNNSGMTSSTSPSNSGERLSKEVDELLRGIARERLGVKFFVDTAADVPESLFGDDSRIRQVLWHLITAAFKYVQLSGDGQSAEASGTTTRPDTADRQVTLTVQLAPSSKWSPQNMAASNAIIKFGVEFVTELTDSDLKALFEPYHQLKDSSDSKLYGGSGVGLATTSKLAELLGGSVTWSRKHDSQLLVLIFTTTVGVVDVFEEKVSVTHVDSSNGDSSVHVGSTRSLSPRVGHGLDDGVAHVDSSSSDSSEHVGSTRTLSPRVGHGLDDGVVGDTDDANAHNVDGGTVGTADQELGDGEHHPLLLVNNITSQYTHPQTNKPVPLLRKHSAGHTPKTSPHVTTISFLARATTALEHMSRHHQPVAGRSPIDGGSPDIRVRSLTPRISLNTRSVRSRASQLHGSIDDDDSTSSTEPNVNQDAAMAASLQLFAATSASASDQPTRQEKKNDAASTDTTATIEDRKENAATEEIAAKKTRAFKSPKSKPMTALMRAHAEVDKNQPFPKSVLVVDDISIHQLIVKRVLHGLCDNILMAEDGAQALAAVQQHGGDIDLVLSDIEMPVMNGVRFLAELRRLGYTVPVCAVTGNAMPTQIASYIEHGFAAVITKPVDFLKLVTTTQRIFVEHVRKQDAAASVDDVAVTVTE